jgi:hypothetical protein
LSKIKSALRGRLLSAQYFFTSGKKLCKNQYSFIIAVTQALELDFQMTGRVPLTKPLSSLGFSARYTSNGFNLQSPAAFAPNSKVNRSFAAL